MVLAETFSTTLLHFWEHLPSPYPPQSESQGSPKTKFGPPVLPENATAGRPAHEVQSSRPARVAGGWASVLPQPCPLLAPGPATCLTPGSVASLWTTSARCGARNGAIVARVVGGLDSPLLPPALRCPSRQTAAGRSRAGPHPYGLGRPFASAPKASDKKLQLETWLIDTISFVIASKIR